MVVLAPSDKVKHKAILNTSQYWKVLEHIKQLILEASNGMPNRKMNRLSHLLEQSSVY